MTQSPIPFQFIGNDLSIDFVNTQVVVRGVLRDLVETPDALAAWFRAAGLKVSKSWTRESFAAARALRQAIREAIKRKATGAPASPSALEMIDAWLAHHDRRLRLAYVEGVYALSPKRDSLTPEAALGLLAQRAAELLVSADPKTLKACANSKCVLMFKDVSRGRKRRWCSMETCGNRAKVAAHYRSSQR